MLSKLKSKFSDTESMILHVRRRVVAFVLDGRNVAMIIFLVLAVSLTYGIVKSSSKNQKLKLDIERLKAENDIMELENENIRLGSKYFSSKSFIELEARRRLNKSLPGETLLILPKH